MYSKIASGYFYDVYDIGNNRVLKQKRPFQQIARSIQGKNTLGFIKRTLKAFHYIRECKQTTQIIKEKLGSIPQQLIGNPEFLNTTDYTQDKVVLLMDYSDTHTLEENKIIIDKYIELIKKFLALGIHDYVYKFKNSYGVNKEGEVIFVDFNEVTLSKEKVLELVTINQWNNEAQFRKFTEGELKEYLRKKFKETLTPEVINTTWKE